MNDADGLVAFLRARLDEAEREARDMIEGAPPGYGKASGVINNPYWVLAEVDAKRRTLEWALTLDYGLDEAMLLRLLALPYADHPDYQPEWAP